MELTDMTNEDLVARALLFCEADVEEAAGRVHDESSCTGCQAWAVYESRGCPRLAKVDQ